MLARLARVFAPVLLLAGCTGCPPSTLIKSYGFAELLPPSTLLAPGAMVAIIDRNPFKVKLICGPRASLGPTWQPNVSATSTRSLAKHSGKSFKIGADVLNSIRGNLDLSAVKDVTATLNNPQIVELEDIDIYENLKYRSRECQMAVDARVRAGFDVSMVSSGLMGDLTYIVKWDNSAKLDAKAKLDAIQHLAIEVGAGNSVVTTDTIKASNLMLGAMDDGFLAAITMTDIDERKVKRQSRVFNPDDVNVFDDVMHPDAPIVHPPRGQRGECYDESFRRNGVFDAGLTPIKPKERAPERAERH